MERQSLKAIAEMIVLLAGVPEDEQLDVLAQVVKTWLERDRDPDYRRLWTSTQK